MIEQKRPAANMEVTQDVNHVIKNMFAIKKARSAEEENEQWEDFYMMTWKQVKGTEFMNYPDKLGAALVKRVLYVAGIEMSKNPPNGFQPLQKLSKAASSVQSGDTVTMGHISRSPSPVSSGQRNVSLTRQVSFAPMEEASQVPFSAEVSGSAAAAREEIRGSRGKAPARSQASSDVNDTQSVSSLASEQVDRDKARHLVMMLSEFNRKKKTELPNVDVKNNKVKSFNTVKVKVVDDLIAFLADEPYNQDIAAFIKPTGANGAATRADKHAGLNRWSKQYQQRE